MSILHIENNQRVDRHIITRITLSLPGVVSFFISSCKSVAGINDTGHTFKFYLTVELSITLEPNFKATLDPFGDTRR